MIELNHSEPIFTDDIYVKNIHKMVLSGNKYPKRRLYVNILREIFLHHFNRLVTMQHNVTPQDFELKYRFENIKLSLHISETNRQYLEILTNSAFRLKTEHNPEGWVMRGISSPKKRALFLKIYNRLSHHLSNVRNTELLFTPQKTSVNSPKTISPNSAELYRL